MAAGSLRLRPTIPTAVGHCVYIRRHALDLVGGFDETFSPGYGEEVDFSQRAVAHGFRHVCADDVFTSTTAAARSFGADRRGGRARRRATSSIVRRALPVVRAVGRAAAEGDAASPPGRRPRRRPPGAASGSTVGVDALCLGPDRMGTQQIVVETIRALVAPAPDIDRLVAFVPPTPPPTCATLRAELRRRSSSSASTRPRPPPDRASSTSCTGPTR